MMTSCICKFTATISQYDGVCLNLLLIAGSTGAAAGKDDVWGVIWLSGQAAMEMEACTDAEVECTAT